MNSVYFACLTCKTYRDAGYRWCYALLERPGIIERDQLISVDAVLQANEYWHSPELEEEHAWPLRRDLPKIRTFLEEHRDHDILYTEEFWFGSKDEFDWMEEEEPELAEVSPRFYAERLGFTAWDQVMEHIEHEALIAPLWSYEPQYRGAARRKFEELVQQRKSGDADTPSIPK